MGGSSKSGQAGAAQRRQAQIRRSPWLARALVVVLLLVGLGLPLPGPGGQAAAIGWPGRSTSPRPAAASRGPSLGEGSPGPGRLQEVEPPQAVQQLQEALAERQPQLRILAPAAESVLGDGPWQLRLQVEDWPLVDAGRLGLGAPSGGADR